MFRNLKRYFEDFVDNRTKEIIDDMAGNNKVFRIFTRKIIKVFDIINNALSLECREFLHELEDLQGKRDLITYKELYKRGLIDGIRLASVLNRKMKKR